MTWRATVLTIFPEMLPGPLAFSLADEDDPDPVIDGKIDLGALATEFFALGLDPYPRKPGVEFVAPAESAPPDSPFAALAARPAKR